VTAELVERGELREEDAPQHPHYGILTRALGVGPTIEIDCMTFTVEQGDRLVLCSDGLFNEVSTAEISSVVAEEKTIASTVDNLIERALHHGGRDNVAVIVAEAAA
jgi:protein phosphatase